METTREIALRTYKDATAHGMMDTPMNWHIWKRAFDTAERELKNLQLGAVSGTTSGRVTDYIFNYFYERPQLEKPKKNELGYEVQKEIIPLLTSLINKEHH